eukprot:18726_1
MSALTDEIITHFLSDNLSRQLIALTHMQFSYVRDPVDEIIERKLVYRLVECIENDTQNKLQTQICCHAWKLLDKVMSSKEGLKQALENNALHSICTLSNTNPNSTFKINGLYYISIHNQSLFIKQISTITNALIKYPSIVKWNKQRCIHICCIILNHWKLLTIKQIANIIKIMESQNIKYKTGFSQVECHFRIKYSFLFNTQQFTDNIKKNNKNNNIMIKTYKTLSDTQYINNESYLDNIIIFMQNEYKLLCYGFIRKK